MNPVSIHRGMAATVDGDGHNVVLAWLADHRGCYELLMIDAETGQTREFPVPFAAGDSPFASVLSSRSRFYSHFDGHFVEFDPAKPGFTFIAKTVPRVAMSMTEGDDGVIWAAIYPNGAAASYNPRTGEFHDYGNLYDQNWMQYPRSVAVDDQGWVYLGIGSTASQILVLDPKDGQGRAGAARVGTRAGLRRGLPGCGRQGLRRPGGRLGRQLVSITRGEVEQDRQAS